MFPSAAVIQEWLNGEQRDKIAVDNGLGAGSDNNPGPAII
jgi:hypothetical protein